VSYTFTVTATNAAGGTSQPSTATSPVIPSVPSGPPPANDDFANARVISGTSGSVVGTNVGATLEPGEPTIQDDGGGASVWYVYTATFNGSVQFDTCSAYPGVNAEIEGFIGSTVGNLSPWGPGPDNSGGCPAGQAGSVVVVPVSTNLTFYIKLDGINNRDGNGPSEGPFTLEWSQVSP
jgi:hypothetical protein